MWIKGTYVSIHHHILNEFVYQIKIQIAGRIYINVEFLERLCRNFKNRIGYIKKYFYCASPFRCFCPVFLHSQMLWELVLLGEPLVVMAPSPSESSETVLALVKWVYLVTISGFFFLDAAVLNRLVIFAALPTCRIFPHPLLHWSMQKPLSEGNAYYSTILWMRKLIQAPWGLEPCLCCSEWQAHWFITWSCSLINITCVNDQCRVKGT